MNCRACNSPISEFFSLGDMPLVNSYPTKEQLSNEEKYRLAVGFCPNCYLVQLMKNIAPEKIFTHYLYFSSTSSSFMKHCEGNAHFFIKKLGLTKKSLVIELASNDGAQLQFFQKLGVRTLGVDPAKNIAKVANQRGIKTIPEFFNLKLAKELSKNKQNMADLVYGANVLAHVPDIVDFVRGVKLILKPRGTASFEFPYLKGLFENKFDIIYDEHVFYYGILALTNLFNRAELEIYDVDVTPVQGGSLRFLASHPGIFPMSDNLLELVKKERADGYDKLENYKKIASNVATLKKNLLGLLDKLKFQGKHIAAYGAPAKGNVLLNYFGINNNYLDFIVDKSEAKQGLYTPGTHLLIEKPSKIDKSQPDYILILCWNIADEVIKQLDNYKKSGGKFIIPVPQVRVT